MRFFFSFIFSLQCFLSVACHAQLLPDNKTLNAQSVSRWMQSNRAMSGVVQVLEGMTQSVEEAAAFERLLPSEQDKKIVDYLGQKNALMNAKEVCLAFGWQSVGEYKRLGERLGNAIAAYFLLKDTANLPEDAVKVLREKADPAVLAVPKRDIDFIKANEKPLREYIQAYAVGR